MLNYFLRKETMERTEDTATQSSGKMFISASVKQEPKSDSETDEENMNNVLDYQVIKAESKDESDVSDAAVYNNEDDEALKIKFEAGDPETVGHGVDYGFGKRLKEEETSLDSNGNLDTVILFFVFLTSM